MPAISNTTMGTLKYILLGQVGLVRVLLLITITYLLPYFLDYIILLHTMLVLIYSSRFDGWYGMVYHIPVEQ